MYEYEVKSQHSPLPLFSWIPAHPLPSSCSAVGDGLSWVWPTLWLHKGSSWKTATVIRLQLGCGSCEVSKQWLHWDLGVLACGGGAGAGEQRVFHVCGSAKLSMQMPRAPEG